MWCAGDQLPHFAPLKVAEQFRVLEALAPGRIDQLTGHALQLPGKLMVVLEDAVGRRARQLMPWVLLVLFGAGMGMVATRYRPLLAAPLDSSFGTLLMFKIGLAASVLMHFIGAMLLFRTGRMTAGRVRFIHVSVFIHLVLIVLLAKGMFYLTW